MDWIIELRKAVMADGASPALMWAARGMIGYPWIWDSQHHAPEWMHALANACPEPWAENLARVRLMIAKSEAQ